MEVTVEVAAVVVAVVEEAHNFMIINSKLPYCLVRSHPHSERFSRAGICV